MDASIYSHTGIKDFLEMPVLRFHEVWQAICRDSEKKARERERADNEARRGGRRRRRR